MGVLMNGLPIDQVPVEKPLEGMLVWFNLASLAELKYVLRVLLAKRAAVCCSPDRHARCDTPATGIFWQDASEWYPCCDEHWPSGSQWLGNTRFYGYRTRINCFAERVQDLNLTEEVKRELYDRTDAA